tara:strand:+ start:1028 stop:1567 length:540 start_codon:yes stop_codon:yes gene_type:complete
MGAKIQFKISKEFIKQNADKSLNTRPPVSIDIDDIVAIGSKIDSFTWSNETLEQDYKYYIPDNVIIFLDGLQYNSVFGGNDGFDPDRDYANRFKCKFSNRESMTILNESLLPTGIPTTNFREFQKKFNLVDATVKAIEALPGNKGVSIVEVGVDDETRILDENQYGPIPSSANAPDAAK